MLAFVRAKIRTLACLCHRWTDRKDYTACHCQDLLKQCTYRRSYAFLQDAIPLLQCRYHMVPRSANSVASRSIFVLSYRVFRPPYSWTQIAHECNLSKKVRPREAYHKLQWLSCLFTIDCFVKSPTLPCSPSRALLNQRRLSPCQGRLHDIPV